MVRFTWQGFLGNEGSEKMAMSHNEPFMESSPGVQGFSANSSDKFGSLYRKWLESGQQTLENTRQVWQLQPGLLSSQSAFIDEHAENEAGILPDAVADCVMAKLQRGVLEKLNKCYH